MIAEIETGIISYLRERWPSNGGTTAVHEFDINLGLDDMVRWPAISVTTERVAVRSIIDGNLNLQPTIGLYSVFKNPAKVAERRLGVYPIVVACMQLLSGETLGLDIDGLKPVSCDEFRHDALKEKGLICFQTLFTTVFTVEAIDTEDAVQLLSERLKYFLGDTNENENATDLISLGG